MTASVAEETKTTEAPINSAADDATSRPSFMVLAADALTVVQSLVQLVLLELRMAAQSVPKILGLAVVAFFLTLFAWLSLSAAVGWLAYHLLGSVGWGILAFLVVQIISLLMCRYLVAIYLRRLTLPNTRNFLKTIQENLREAIDGN